MLQETHANQIETLLTRYPDPRSAVLPLLYMAQDTYGPLTTEVIREVAEILDMPYTDVFEVVGFYTLFYDQPFGKWVIQVCDDVPCCYTGAEELIAALKQRLNIRENETSDDGMFTLQRVKCLAACHRPPVVQANLCYFYDVTVERMDAFLHFLREYTDGPEAASVSGHHAEDYEPTPEGTFRHIARQLGDIPHQPGTAPVAPTIPEAAQQPPPSPAATPAEQQVPADSPVEAAPDHSPAGAHPDPEKQDEPGGVPASAAQQQPPEEKTNPDA
jgi:NADH-quinone oxidoreductase subunit E